MSSDTQPGALVTVLYKRTPDLKFDMDYYRDKHIPFAKSIWTKHGLLRVDITEPESDTEFAVKTVMAWKDLDAWKAALADAETKGIMGDVERVTNAPPIFVPAKIVG
ncbi:hypothetical protein K491DRAFT_605343 [Lophiostoma macrostomum CBS 122681]|uniref:EthD domain-containing protein n=1 Tax=Lophiostoma macrostomum CBS 122681 TaxID=1314788 RepID=A0A6A6SXB8_9PLEO|nr:hypothetical protein K491DRAFT_605343 [Lophiostoma macrostomum CBS 122681]